ncbi:MAG: cyclic pyranopterin monophosphate synthase MoaC [Aestuariivirgaceae bacterium]|jgi:cyclic pyranopterin monophosphate synthase
MAKARLTHLDADGRARMVDVSDKAVTLREATAGALVVMEPATLALITAGKAPKGDVLAAARIAGIMAAKRTHELIPLCHPLMISKIAIELAPAPDRSAIAVTATVAVEGKTGVEMEALTAVSVACLTLYDMVKAVDRGMRITDIRLIAKSGGRSGDYRAD